jgi:hypothetical protein
LVDLRDQLAPLAVVNVLSAFKAAATIVFLSAHSLASIMINFSTLPNRKNYLPAVRL